MSTRLRFVSCCLTIITSLVLVMASTSVQAQCTTDADQDGFIDAACGGSDCDDTDSEIYPGAVEIPGDGIDSDCDGREICFQDNDGDGFSSSQGTSVSDLTCSGPNLFPTSDGDCDDSDASVYPGAPEIPANGIDEDCNGVDEAPIPTSPDSWGMLKARY